MGSASSATVIQGQRRHERSAVSLMAHLRHDLSRLTVMLKDLSPSGARIEGIAGLSPDQAVSLALPGHKPALAFVAWANDHCAGLEFAEPIHLATLNAIIAQFGVGTQSRAQVRPLSLQA